jgi:aspartate kinase
MKVFKFGGASIKDYKSIIRLSRIIRKENHDRMIIIVSAMGKTTNSIEKLVLSYLNSSKDFKDKLELIKNFHLDIIKNLFKKNNSSITNIVQAVFDEIDKFLKTNKETDYNLIYDQIVSYGEILSNL